jgi:hypothetical protein
MMVPSHHASLTLPRTNPTLAVLSPRKGGALHAAHLARLRHGRVLHFLLTKHAKSCEAGRRPTSRDG